MGRVTSLPEHRVQGASEHPRGGCCWASVGLTLQATHPFPELLVISRAEQQPRLLSDQEWCLEGSLPYRGGGTAAKATTARGRAGEQPACGRVTAPTFLHSLGRLALLECGRHCLWLAGATLPGLPAHGAGVAARTPGCGEGQVAPGSGVL